MDMEENSTIQAEEQVDVPVPSSDMGTDYEQFKVLIDSHFQTIKNLLKFNKEKDANVSKMNNFGEREPQAPKAEKLSQPIKQEEKHYDKYGVEILNEDESHNIDRQIQNGYRR